MFGNSRPPVTSDHPFYVVARSVVNRTAATRHSISVRISEREVRPSRYIYAQQSGQDGRTKNAELHVDRLLTLLSG